MIKTSIEDVYKEITKQIREERQAILGLSYLLSSIDPSRLDLKGRENFRKIIENAKALKSSVAKKLKLVDMIYETSITDSLTGLRNRRYFDEILKPRLDRAGNMSYLMMDVDHFGDYNDQFGHLQGDEALITITGIIKDKSGRNIAIRYGGEEFSVILVRYESPWEEAYKHAEEIRTGVEKAIIRPYSKEEMLEHLTREMPIEKGLQERVRIPMNVFFNDALINDANYAAKLEEYFAGLGNEICAMIRSCLIPMQKITISVGGASRIKGESIDNVIKRADDALYKAKETRNSVVMAK